MMIKNFVSDQTWFKEEQDPLSTMQNTGLANYFSFLVWKRVLPMDVITLGQSTTIFLCVRPFSAWWQPNDPSASLLFTSESLLQKLLKLKGDQGALWFSEWFGRGDRCCGKIFFWHYSIKIIGNFLICFLLLNWFFSIKFIRSFSNRKMSIINRNNSIKFQNIWQNSICYKALCCQKVKVQNWSSWLSWLWLSL